MQSFKNYVFLALIGGVLGALAATFFAPGIIAWWVTPGIPGTQSNVNLTEVSRYIIGRFVQAQAIGAVGGGLVAVVLGFVLRGGKKKPVAAPTETPVSKA